MQRPSKSPFADKFQSYVQKVLDPRKSEKLFQGQFTQESQNLKKVELSPNPTRDYSKLMDSSNSVSENSCHSSHYSFDSSQFSYSRLNRSSAKSNQLNQSHRKRLKKLKELEQNECAICLDQIKNQCWIECKHKFCFDCLQEWLKSSNRCPYCRMEVDHFWHKGQQFKVQARQFEYEGTQEDNMDWVCYNCDATREGDIVLICDRCEAYACHVECDPTLGGVEPVGDWYCHFCR